MKLIRTYLRFSRKLARYLADDLGVDDKTTVDEWVNESSENRQVFNDLKEGRYYKKRLGILKLFSKEKSWSDIKKKIKKEQRGKIRLTNFYRYAAAIAFILMLGGGYFIFQNSPPKQLGFADIEPGSSKAILILGDGQKFVLDKRDTLLSTRQSLLEIDPGRISYTSKKRIAKKIEYNTIVTPKGGEYQLQLSDGTIVWLNAQSSVTYPIAFDDKQRLVELSGEAYFQVTHDNERPFLVKTSSETINVLGTEFNVKAYEDESISYTTLIRGKVEISNGADKVIIEPNQQVVNLGIDNKLQTKEVNVAIYTAWKDGMFVFKDEPLSDIMRAVGRWYNVDVLFDDDEIKMRRFSVRVNRLDNIETMVNVLELTDRVQFEYKNEKIRIMSK